MTLLPDWEAFSQIPALLSSLLQPVPWGHQGKAQRAQDSMASQVGGDVLTAQLFHFSSLNLVPKSKATQKLESVFVTRC
jgi:hypothetical protein